MYNRVKKRFDVAVTSANTAHTKTFDLDKNIVAIHGIILTSDRDDLLHYRGTTKVELDRKEIFDELYESKLLMTSVNVPTNLRYFDLGGIPPGNGKLKVVHTDNNTSVIAFAPYRVSVNLDYEVAETL